MLHSILNFFVCLNGLPLVVVYIVALVLGFLDSTLSKRKNLNSFNLKISYIIGRNIVFNFCSRLTFLLLVVSLLLTFTSKSYLLSNSTNELVITNNSLSIFFFIQVITLFILYFVLNLRATSTKQSNNLTLTFLIIISPYIFFYNSLLVLFFFIEIISILIFLLLLNSLYPIQILQKKKKITSTYQNINYKKLNTNFRYSIFVYYWFSFFFSIFFFLFLTYLSIGYNFIDLISLNLFSNNYIHYTKDSQFNVIHILFIILLIVKFGLPPFHLQKISVYKGLPLNLSLTYSIIIILTYFFIFTNIFYTLPGLFFFLKNLLKIILLISTPFLLIVLFKELNIKAFFGYSSILNTSILFLVLFLY